MTTSSQPILPETDGPAAQDAQDPQRKLVLLTLLLTFITYAGTLRFEFVFDDRPQIVENLFIQKWSSIPSFFTHNVWDTVVAGGIGNFYRPLFLVWFVLNYKLFGLNPLGWHFTTILIHVLATYMVYWLARRIARQGFIAAVAALVFGLHPAHIETVSWISGVTDSLLTVCFVGSFLCFLRSRDAGEPRTTAWRVGSLLLFVLALLFKEPAIVLPALIFAYEILFPAAITREPHVSNASNDRIQQFKAAVLDVAPFLAISVLYLSVRYAVLHGFTHSMTNISTKIELQTWPSLVWFYIRHLLWPFGISAFYETPYIDPATWQNFGIPLLLVLIAVSGLVFWWRHSQSPVVAFCAVWIALPLAPALKIATFQYAELAHDRYLYLPSIGFAILVGILVDKLRFGQRRFFGQPAPAAAALLGLAILYGMGTTSQSVQWANTLLLYARGAEIAPGNVHTIAPLGIELLHRERYQEAIPVLERTVMLAPTDWQARFMLAHTCFIVGRYGEAERQYLEAIKLNQNSAAEYYFLGLTMMKTNRIREAEVPLRRAIEILPAGRGFHEALGMVLMDRGELAEARREFETELRNDPTNSNARQQLASLQSKEASQK